MLSLSDGVYLARMARRWHDHDSLVSLERAPVGNSLRMAATPLVSADGVLLGSRRLSGSHPLEGLLVVVESTSSLAASPTITFGARGWWRAAAAPDGCSCAAHRSRSYRRNFGIH